MKFREISRAAIDGLPSRIFPAAQERRTNIKPIADAVLGRIAWAHALAPVVKSAQRLVRGAPGPAFGGFGLQAAEPDGTRAIWFRNSAMIPLPKAGVHPYPRSIEQPRI